MKIRIIKYSVIILFFSNILFAKSDTKYFQEGLNLFNNKKYSEAKFKFEQDLVFNPKSEMSYLYLSKIFNNLENKDLEEQNLNTVILLNPKNEEALFELALLKIRKSNYSETEKLINTFKSVCKKMCSKSQELENKLIVANKTQLCVFR